jgi:hypothetical protein
VPSPPPSQTTETIADDLVVLDNKIKQLKFEYNLYFTGSRPREPVLLRGEVQKLVTRYSNTGIANTALRFKFNTITARYFALRRQWDAILKQIEEGTYKLHAFKADLRERERGAPAASPKGAAAGSAPGHEASARDGRDLFDAYAQAQRECGEDPKGLTRAQLDQLLDRQRAAIQQRFGCDEVRFRVVVEDGKAKLKATPVKAAKPA